MMLSALLRTRSGAAALEAAIVTPLLAGMLMVAVDMGNAWLFRLQLEQAAQRGLEFALAPGRTQGDYNSARLEMIAAWGRPYTNAGVTTWLECDGVRQTSFTGSCPTGQQYARFVNLVIRANYQPAMGWGGVIDPGRGGVVNLRGDAVARLQ